MPESPRGLPPDQRQSEGRASRRVMQDAVDLPGVQRGAEVCRPCLDSLRGVGFDDLDAPTRRAQGVFKTGPSLVTGKIKR